MFDMEGDMEDPGYYGQPPEGEEYYYEEKQLPLETIIEESADGDRSYSNISRPTPTRKEEKDVYLPKDIEADMYLRGMQHKQKQIKGKQFTDRVKYDIEKSVQLSQMSEWSVMAKKGLNPNEVIDERQRLRDKEELMLENYELKSV